MAFFWAWTGNKSLRLSGGSDRTTLTVLRRMMPRNEGPPLRLYRSATARTAQECLYGMSWTMNLEIADNFARKKQSYHFHGGRVVLATLAPPAATEIEEIAAREGMPASALKKLPRHEFHDETEYIVDGSALDAVEIVRRYPSS